MFVPAIGDYLPVTVRYPLFADDVKIYAPVRNLAERAVLQVVLREPHVTIHKRMSCTHQKERHPPPVYTVDGEDLPVVHCIRDLGRHRTYIETCDLFKNTSQQQNIQTLCCQATRLLYPIVQLTLSAKLSILCTCMVASQG